MSRGDLADQPAQRAEIIGGHPPVDGDLHHLGAGLPQPVAEVRQRLAVQLDRDAAARHALVQQASQHLVGGLAVRRPGLHQAGRPHRTLGLRAAHQQLGLGDALEQRLPHPPAIGRLHPATKADARRGEDDVGRLLHAQPGGGLQLCVVAGRDDADGRRLHRAGATALQERSQLLAPARRRDGHGEAGERELVHRISSRRRPPVGGPWCVSGVTARFRPFRAARRALFSCTPRGGRYPGHQPVGWRGACAISVRTTRPGGCCRGRPRPHRLLRQQHTERGGRRLPRRIPAVHEQRRTGAGRAGAECDCRRRGLSVAGHALAGRRLCRARRSDARRRRAA